MPKRFLSRSARSDRWSPAPLSQIIWASVHPAGCPYSSWHSSAASTISTVMYGGSPSRDALAASFFQKPKMALMSCETTSTARTKQRMPESAPATGPAAEAAAPARAFAAPFLAASPVALAAVADSDARAALGADPCPSGLGPLGLGRPLRRCLGIRALPGTLRRLRPRRRPLCGRGLLGTRDGGLLPPCGAHRGPRCPAGVARSLKLVGVVRLVGGGVRCERGDVPASLEGGLGLPGGGNVCVLCFSLALLLGKGLVGAGL